MSKITVTVPDELVAALDKVADELRKTPSEVVCAAIEHYVEEYGDLEVGVARLCNPADAVLDWDEVRRDLLAQD